MWARGSSPPGAGQKAPGDASWRTARLSPPMLCRAALLALLAAASLGATCGAPWEEEEEEGCGAASELQSHHGPLQSSLVRGERACYAFLLGNAWRDVTVELAVLSGSAALFLLNPGASLPAVGPRGPVFPEPSAGNALWRSGGGPRVYSIFVPHTDARYATGTWLLSVAGESVAPAAFRLGYTTTTGARNMSESDRSHVDAFLASCCPEWRDGGGGGGGGGVCAAWAEQRGSAERLQPCALPGFACSPAGDLLHLALPDEGLACPFPSDALGSMAGLRSLELPGNRLRGPVDWAKLAELPSLMHLDLSRNELSGDISCHLAGGPLTILDLSHNQFTGGVPTCYIAKRGLDSLLLGHNRLGGALPDGIPPSPLRRLSLPANGLKGALPSLEPLRQLEELDLGDNGLEGPLPDLSLHRRLVALSLRANSFEGRVPEEWLSLPHLESLDLSGNALGGAIPEGLCSGPSITEVRLSGCGLMGVLSCDGDAAACLRVLDVSNNSLEGRLPPALLHAPALAALDVSANLLGGELPAAGELVAGAGGRPAYAPLNALMWLNGSHNHFMRPQEQGFVFPDSWQALPMFAATPDKGGGGEGRLDLSFNELSGRIPAYAVPPRSAAVLWLHNNTGAADGGVGGGSGSGGGGGNSGVSCAGVFGDFAGLGCPPRPAWRALLAALRRPGVLPASFAVLSAAVALTAAAAYWDVLAAYCNEPVGGVGGGGDDEGGGDDQGERSLEMATLLGARNRGRGPKVAGPKAGGAMDGLVRPYRRAMLPLSP